MPNIVEQLNTKLSTDKQSRMLSNLQEDEKFLSFLLAGETYGIGILAIKEIIEYINVAKIPMVPDYIRGVINLRGNVLPIIDLAKRLDRDSTDINKRTCIVIVEISSENEILNIGFLVDSVNEVLDIAAQDIEPAPAFGTSIDPEFIQGLGRVNGVFLTLLDLQRVLDVEKLSDFEIEFTTNMAGGHSLSKGRKYV